MCFRWICYMGLLGIFLYLQYYYNDPMSLLLVFILLLILPISLLYALAGLKFLHTQISAMPSAVEKGSNVTLKIRIENSSFLFFPHIWTVFQIMGQSETKKIQRLRFRLAGWEERLVEYTISCPYCGAYDNAVLKISFSDPFGLFRFFRKPKDKVSILVLPRLIVLPQSAGFLDEESERTSALETAERGNTSVAGIRDYTPGDPLRNIHWKLTAKWERPMVKEFDFIKKDRDRILVDRYMKTTDPAKNDCILETAAALALRYLTENHPADFAWIDKNGSLVDIPLSSREDFDNFFPLIAASKNTIQPECQPENLVELLLNSSFFSGGPVTVITASQSSSFYQKLIHIADSHLFPIRIILIGKPETGLEPLLEKMQNSGVILIIIPDGDIASAFAGQ